MSSIQEVATDVQVIRYLATFFIVWSVCMIIFLTKQESLNQETNDLIVKVMVCIGIIGTAIAVLALTWLWLS